MPGAQEMFHDARGKSRLVVGILSLSECPVSSHSIRVKTLKVEPDWKPRPPPWDRPALRLTWVAPASDSLAVPKLVFCAIATILPVPGSTEVRAILIPEGS